MHRTTEMYSYEMPWSSCDQEERMGGAECE